MSRRPIAEVRVIRMPHLAEGCVRVEVECSGSTTGLTQVPGLMQALTSEQMVTAAVFEHESRCGRCDTERAHAQGDRRVREMTDRAWEKLIGAAQRRYAASRRN
jgi:hypothetical protein